MNIPLRTKVPGRGNRLLRFLDRYAGIPVVALMGALREKRELPSRLNRIGMLSTAAIGDTLLSGAIVSDLRFALPAASVIYFAGDTNYKAALLLSGPSKVIRLPVYHPLEASRVVREQCLDLLIDLGPWPRLNAVISGLSGAKFTAGFRTAGQHRHYVYDLAVTHSSAAHELDNLRQLITGLGVKASHLPAIDLQKIPTNPRIVPPEPYLLFHLWPGGTRSREKQWPRERWVRLINNFVAQGYSVVLSGASSQHPENQDVIDSVHHKHRTKVRNAAGLDLAETAALAAKAQIVVSVDTGVMHLAAVLGVPVIGLHGPASSSRWGPVGRGAVAIDSPDPYAGYLHLGFERSREPARCMEAISYERVLGECLKTLNRRSSPVRSK